MFEQLNELSTFINAALRVQYNKTFRVLFGLPHFCRACYMFAEARTDCFLLPTIIRKHCASLLAWLRGRTIGILSAIADIWFAP